MSISVSFGNVTKRKNSTLQGVLSTSYNVVLKENCSLDRPVFLVSASGMDYNAAKWDNRYYFVEDVVSVRNNQWEVHCALDVLATYKADILASTQFVTYSSVSGGTWLADTRIPILKSATVAKASTTLNFLFTDAGFYVLSAVGENGCKTYGLDQSNVNALLSSISSWTNDLRNDATNALPHSSPTDETEALENIYTTLIQTGTIGNAYLDAPNCIRSCIWVPFFASFFVSGAGGATIHLGAFDTGVPALPCQTTPVSRTASVSIPWQYSDWRRTVCEEVYLYLPLVGLVSIPSDEIVGESAINIEWSATASDGCIAYRLTAGNQVIGTYGANCAVNVPLGISQQASAGEIVQTALAGVQSTVSSGIESVANGLSGNIAGAISSGVNAGFSAVNAAYQTANTALTRHNSCIGGIGGGAGVGLDLDCTCFTIAHPTVISPSDMAATMGVPTMKPITLSSCSGFCQCANAHIAAAAESPILDAIDSMLNSGFYIE